MVFCAYWWMRCKCSRTEACDWICSQAQASQQLLVLIQLRWPASLISYAATNRHKHMIFLWNAYEICLVLWLAQTSKAQPVVYVNYTYTLGYNCRIPQACCIYGYIGKVQRVGVHSTSHLDYGPIWLYTGGAIKPLGFTSWFKCPPLVYNSNKPL